MAYVGSSSVSHNFYLLLNNCLQGQASDGEDAPFTVNQNNNKGEFITFIFIIAVINRELIVVTGFFIFLFKKSVLWYICLAIIKAERNAKEK